MLTGMVRISKMSYLDIQNRSQCLLGCALEVHLTQIFCFKVPQRGSCIKIWRVKCNGKCLKHVADASDCQPYIALTKCIISLLHYQPFHFQQSLSYCKTGNIRELENFAIFANIVRFAKFSCSRILLQDSTENSRNFPVAKLPTPRFREIFLS